jgi:hypothetical protein
MPDMKLSEADKAKYYRQGERRLRDWMPSCRAKANRPPYVCEQ